MANLFPASKAPATVTPTGGRPMFDKHQFAVIEAMEGAYCVDAGAGSGKTTALTERTARLIIAGVRPHEILLVTFTVKAANEMAERVQRVTGQALPWATNFHKLCLRLISMYPEIGIDRGFIVIDPGDQARIVKRIAREGHGIEKPETTLVDAVLDQVEQQRHFRMGYRKTEFTLEATQSPIIATLADDYEALIRKENKLDFDRMILDVVLALRENRFLRERISSRWRYVMIDEGQDTDEAQFELIGYLGCTHGNIMLVGDMDQGIYAFRGARNRNIMDFIRDFSAKVLPMEFNYRSRAEILECANRVIGKNEERLPKVLRATRGSGGNVRNLEAGHSSSEASWIVEQIENALRHERPSEIAVLYRISSVSREIESALSRRRIPYRVVGGLRFWDRAEVKDTLAHARVMLGTLQRETWERVFFSQAMGIGDKTVTKLMKAPSMEEGIRMFAGAKANAWLTKLLDARTRIQGGEKAFETLRWFLEISGYNAEIRTRNSAEDAEQRLANISETLNAMAVAPNLQEWLDEVMLGVPSRDDDSSKPCVVLSTIHAAKGLEWNRVFIAACNQGIMPHARALDEGNVEEERRLFYVAITRARIDLAVSYAKLRMNNGKTIPATASMFLKEMTHHKPERIF